MGLLHQNILKPYFQYGLYSKNNLSTYKINVDGECLRYKGMYENNLTHRDAEISIASSSFDCLVEIIQNIEAHIGLPASEIKVYMDGSRPVNKTDNRVRIQQDNRLIRGHFKFLCIDAGYKVHELEQGESELQMYLLRDEGVDLNVFITNDSDMMSICYGHEPKFINIDSIVPENRKNPSAAIDFETKLYLACEPPTMEFENAKPVQDFNRSYKSSLIIRDSCVWIDSHNTEILRMYGFDFCARFIGFDTDVFRTYLAISGTDYTMHLLTQSAAKAILTLSDSEKKILADYKHDRLKLIALIILFSVKAERITLKKESTAKNANITINFNMEDFKKTVDAYVYYIRSGTTETEKLGVIDGGLVVRDFLYAMQEKREHFSRKDLYTWANSVKIDQALENLKYLGCYMDKVNMRRRIMNSTVRRKLTFDEVSENELGESSSKKHAPSSPTTTDV